MNAAGNGSEAAFASLLRNVEGLAEAAEGACLAGGKVEELCILIGHEGEIHMKMDSSDWPLESLLLHHGAKMAYRVSRRDDRVRIEGQAGQTTCLCETARPRAAAGRLLLAGSLYQLAITDQGRRRSSILPPACVF